MNSLEYLQFALRACQSIFGTLTDVECRKKEGKIFGKLDLLMNELEKGIEVAKEEVELRDDLVKRLKKSTENEEELQREIDRLNGEKPIEVIEEIEEERE